jgi:hypothetical protein
MDSKGVLPDSTTGNGTPITPGDRDTTIDLRSTTGEGWVTTGTLPTRISTIVGTMKTFEALGTSRCTIRMATTGDRLRWESGITATTEGGPWDEAMIMVIAIRRVIIAATLKNGEALAENKSENYTTIIISDNNIVHTPTAMPFVIIPGRATVILPDTPREERSGRAKVVWTMGISVGATTTTEERGSSSSSGRGNQNNSGGALHRPHPGETSITTIAAAITTPADVTRGTDFPTIARE